MDHTLEHLAAYESFFIASEKTQSISPSSVAFLACSVNNDALLMCAETPDLMETAYEVAQEGIKDTLEAIAHRIIRSVDTVLSKFKTIGKVIGFIQNARIKAANRLAALVTGNDPDKEILSPDAALALSSFMSLALGIAVIYFTGMGPQLWDSVKASKLVKAAVDLFKSGKDPITKTTVKDTGRLRVTFEKMPKASFMSKASNWTTQKWDAFLVAFSDIPKLIGKIITGTNNFVSNAAKSFSDTFIKPIATTRYVPSSGLNKPWFSNLNNQLSERYKIQAFFSLASVLAAIATVVGIGIRYLWRLVKSLTNYKEPKA